MNGSSRYIVIELMIKSLSDFIERLFIGNDHTTLKENDLKKSLRTKADLSFIELTDRPFSELKNKLDKLDINLINDITVFLFEKTNQETKNKKYKASDSDKKVNLRNLELIDYLETCRNAHSLERYNIKNSLQHRV